MMNSKKIILPKDKEQRDYVLFLFKNRNNYHKMLDRDINNLVKLLSLGKLEKKDFPKLKKRVRKCNNVNGMCFSKFQHSYSKII